MSTQTSACARTSLPRGEKDSGQVWCSSGKRMIETPNPEGGATVADLAYREVYAMTRTKARPRLVTTYQETGSIRFVARCAAWASAQTFHATPAPDPTSDSFASTTSL
jgi:hypothetical protein